MPARDRKLSGLETCLGHTWINSERIDDHRTETGTERRGIEHRLIRHDGPEASAAQ
jgi:hypothetical protein